MLVSLPIAQATTGAEVFFVPVPFATRLKSIKLVAGQALTADGTNHLTVSILAADGATSLASRTTDSGSSGTSLQQAQLRISAFQTLLIQSLQLMRPIRFQLL